MYKEIKYLIFVFIIFLFLLMTGRYYFSETEILTQPSKDITMPDCEVGINITDDQLKALKQAGAVLGHNDLAITGENGVVTAKVFDEKDATSNTYEMELDRDNACKTDFNFVITSSLDEP